MPCNEHYLEQKIEDLEIHLDASREGLREAMDTVHRLREALEDICRGYKGGCQGYELAARAEAALAPAGAQEEAQDE